MALRRCSLYNLLPFVVLVAIQAGAPAQRAIPDNNLAYPVLITLGDGSSGSGFYLNAGGGLYLVTAKHVLFNALNQTLLSTRLDLLSYSANPQDLGKIRLTVDLSILQLSGMVKPHPTQDVAVVRLFDLPSQSIPPPAAQPKLTTTAQADGPITPMRSLPGVTLQSWVGPGIVSAGLDGIKTFDKVLVGNEVMLFGYPSSLALQELKQLDPSRPLLRKGIVAGTNIERKSIILDCPVYFGNSGGPVLEMDRDGFTTRLHVMGVVNQYVPFVQSAGAQTFAMQLASNSGYSIITPMDYVLELTK
jgi:Trypsin-like peptidase domain